MRTISFTDTEARVSRNQIDSVATALGITFPEEFIKHYVEFNGGTPSHTMIKKGRKEYLVQEFLPLIYGEDTIEETFADLNDKEDPILPSHLVAFACDPGGDYYCLSVRPVDNGSVWYFSHEHADSPTRALRLLCNSFTSFLNELTTED